MESEQDLEALRGDAAALAAAARLGLLAAVPSCPGWNVANVIIHLGTVYRGWVAVIGAHGAAWPLDIRRQVLMQTFPELVALFEQGEKGVTARTIPDGLIDWFDEGAAELVETFRMADLDESFWQPPDWPPPGAPTVRALLAAANVETAVHRWDAQRAHQQPDPIDRVVAEMGIEQALRQMIVLNRWYVREVRRSPVPLGQGETYLIQQTDGNGTWLLRFEGENVTVEGQAGDADVSLRGTASDLFLFLWHRLPAARLDVTGDHALLDRYFELAPPL